MCLFWVCFLVSAYFTSIVQFAYYKVPLAVCSLTTFAHHAHDTRSIVGVTNQLAKQCPATDHPHDEYSPRFWSAMVQALCLGRERCTSKRRHLHKLIYVAESRHALSCVSAKQRKSLINKTKPLTMLTHCIVVYLRLTTKRTQM